VPQLPENAQNHGGHRGKEVLKWRFGDYLKFVTVHRVQDLVEDLKKRSFLATD
jgi:hypothetical protein